MRSKKLVTTAIALALTISSSITSFAGWVNTPAGWKYDWGNQTYCENGWVQYKNHWFYFGSDQIMRTGWINPDGNWYFAADSGELQGGLLKINGNAYYMNTTSLKMTKGNRSVDNETYYFTENGTTNGSPYIYQEWNSNGTLKRGVKFGV